jgi:hypothetical protein
MTTLMDVGGVFFPIRRYIFSTMRYSFGHTRRVSISLRYSNITMISIRLGHRKN